MTDREKALIILQNCLDYENGEKSIYPMIPIEIYRKVLKTAVEALKEQKSHGEWIPCSERLPKRDELVLVSFKTGGVHLCKYLDDGSENPWWSYIDDCCAWNNTVDAWMPLPEPYKEEGDEK